VTGTQCYTVPPTAKHFTLPCASGFQISVIWGRFESDFPVQPFPRPCNPVTLTLTLTPSPDPLLRTLEYVGFLPTSAGHKRCSSQAHGAAQAPRVRARSFPEGPRLSLIYTPALPTRPHRATEDFHSEACHAGHEFAVPGQNLPRPNSSPRTAAE
jgi:hypothetical protein